MEKQLEDVPVGEDWLVILDGMGRSLESNWDVSSIRQKGVQTLNLAMIKSEIVAVRLCAGSVRLSSAWDGERERRTRRQGGVERREVAATREVYFVSMRLQRALVVLERQPAGWNFEPNARAGGRANVCGPNSETWPGVFPRAVG